MRGRFVRSRSPPQPKTQETLSKPRPLSGRDQAIELPPFTADKTVNLRYVSDIEIDIDQLKADIANNKSLIAELRIGGMKKDWFKLKKDGLRKVTAGITSLEELKRVIG